MRAYNAGGDSAYSNCASAITGHSNTPASPTSLKATSITSNRINLTWEDASGNETGFRIYRKAGDGTWVLINTTAANATIYSDTTATGNNSTTAYSYYLQACNANGCSPQTNIAVVPYSPTNLTATAGSTGVINLQWQDKSNNETGFEVHRKDGNCTSTGVWGKIATMPANTTTYNNTGLTSGNTYSYRTRAFNKTSAAPYANGYSGWSNCAERVAP